MKHWPDDERGPTLAKLEWLFMPQSEFKWLTFLMMRRAGV
jgi:hypothetical protein